MTAVTPPTTPTGQPGGAGLGHDSDPAGTSQRQAFAATPAGTGVPRPSSEAAAADDARPTPALSDQPGSPAGSGTHVEDTAGKPGVSVAEPALSGAEGPHRVSNLLPNALREPLRPANFVERVRDLVARQGAGGRTEVRLALDPPTLGQVRLRITQVGKMIRLQLMVENAAAARALDRQMPGLSSALARLGTTLEEASVRLVEMSGAARHESGGQGHERTADQTSTSDAGRDASEMGGGSGRRRDPTEEEIFAELVGDVPAGEGRARRPASGTDAGVAERPTGDGTRGRTVDRIA